MKDIVIIPTYNENGNIQVIIPLICEVLPEAGILVVDDNSPDGTANEVIKLQNKYPQLSLLQRAGKEGLAKAYVVAFKKVLEEGNARSVIMMDADLSHNPSYLQQMVEKAGPDVVVIGSRYVPGGCTKGWNARRRFLSRWGNRYAKLVTNLSVRDGTGGFNMIPVSLLKKLPLDKIDATGYAFQIELKLMLQKAGAKFKEIPIEFKERREGKSKISTNIIKEGLIAPWKMRGIILE